VGDAESMLEDLVDVHLLMTAAVGRYFFHDLLRQYAVDSGEAGERQDAQRRLFDIYAIAARRAESRIEPGKSQLDLVETGDVAAPDVADHRAALDWFAAEHANLVAAIDSCVEQGLDAHAITLCSRTWTNLYFHGRRHDALALAEKGLAAARRLGHVKMQGGFANQIALGHFTIGDYAAAAKHFYVCLEMRTNLGDAKGLASVLNNLGVLHRDRGEYAESADHLNRAIEKASESEAFMFQALARCNLSETLMRLGRFAEADAQLDRAAETAAMLGDERRRTVVLQRRGDLAQRRGEFAEALRLHERAVAYHREYEEPDDLASSLSGAARDLVGLGRPEEALERAHRSLETLSDDSPRFETELLTVLAAAQRAAGDRESAEESLRAAAQIARGIGLRRHLADAERDLAECLLADGDRAAAFELLRDALEYYVEAGFPEVEEIRNVLADENG
ncbi:MAG: tetratricopeptide repeat protein, partial [Stackebrandtia sp.]